MKRFWIIGLSMWAAATGCATDGADVVDAKGLESALPGTGKDDSFRKPTEHGGLRFGVASEASLTEDARFHVWEFEVADKAEIVVRTNPLTPNLDTVLYLYKRDAGETNWGSYLKRNDDHDGNIWSRLSFTATAGQYRILVKGYKTSLRGDFQVLSECTGDGCPLADDGTTAGVHSMPAYGDLTQGCYAAVEAAAMASVWSKDEFSINYERERITLDGLAQKAVDYYAEYWQDIGYWADMDWDGEGHDLNVAILVGEDGTHVEVDAGGDEDTLTFLFDGAGTLLAYFHSEQSPTFGFFCEADDTAALEEPEEFCFGAFIDYLPHDDDSTQDFDGRATVANAESSNELDPMARMAIASYAANVLVDGVPLADTAEVEFTGAKWESAEWGYGATLTLRTDGAPSVTYQLGGSEYDAVWVFTATDGTGASRFLCEQESF